MIFAKVEEAPEAAELPATFRKRDQTGIPLFVTSDNSTTRGGGLRNLLPTNEPLMYSSNRQQLGSEYSTSKTAANCTPSSICVIASRL